MTLDEIARLRLRSQQIAGSNLATPAEVVARLGALQAQDYAGACWSIGLRLAGRAAESDVERALAQRVIVRTWPLRGTLHFVTAQDVRWMVALSAPRIIAGSALRYRQLELDEGTLARSSQVLADALEGNKQLTRSELLAILEQHGISTLGQRAAHMLARASLDGLICQGVTRRNDPTYFSLSDLPEAPPLDHAEALVELAGRYFTSRGPATLADFVWWSGLTALDARVGLEGIEPDLFRETINGKTFWRSGLVAPGTDASPAVYLLPGFDEYMLSYKDRSAAVDLQRYKEITPGNGMFASTIVIDGRVVGTWKRTLKKRSVAISCDPFITLNTAEEIALAAACERYGDFLGMPAELIYPPGPLS